MQGTRHGQRSHRRVTAAGCRLEQPRKAAAAGSSGCCPVPALQWVASCCLAVHARSNEHHVDSSEMSKVSCTAA